VVVGPAAATLRSPRTKSPRDGNANTIADFDVSAEGRYCVSPKNFAASGMDVPSGAVTGAVVHCALPSASTVAGQL
jgi:hypothetical protein